MRLSTMATGVAALGTLALLISGSAPLTAPAGSRPSAVAPATLTFTEGAEVTRINTGDGQPALVLERTEGRAVIPRRPQTPPAVTPLDARSTDLDGDHVDDFVFGLTVDTPSWPTYTYEAIQIEYSRTDTVDRLFVPGPQAGPTGMPFGKSMAAGDFNRDGFQDLALGQPMPSNDNWGRIWVLYGSPTGLSRDTITKIARLDIGPIEPTILWYPQFGTSLAAGDIDNDGFCDLAVGAPTETVDQVGGVGTVTVLRGGGDGLQATRSHLLRPGFGAVPGPPFRDTGFGSTLALGDVNGDGAAELFIRDAGWKLTIGSYVPPTVSRQGTTASGFRIAQLLLRFTPGLTPTPSPSWDFGGGAVTVADVNGDQFGDVLFGVPGAQVDGQPRAGAIIALWGGKAPLSAERSQVVHLNTPGVPGTAFPDLYLGAAMAAGDITGDGIADLVIGGPPHGYTSPPPVVLVLHGSTTGLGGGQLFNDLIPELAEIAIPFTSFGGTVAMLDHDADGDLDIVVTAPTIRFNGSDDGVIVLFRNDAGHMAVDEIISVVDFEALRSLGNGLLSR